MSAGTGKVPLGPVASTRTPCLSAATSPVHIHIMLRVARDSRVSLAEYAAGLASEISPVGCSISNGTFGLLDSTSCSTISRDSNLYDLFMPSTWPSRTTRRIQSWELLGGVPVKWSPLNLDLMVSPSAGLIQ